MMKNAFLLILCFIFLKKTYAQNDIKSTSFIREVITEKDSIHYFDCLGKYSLDEIKRAMKRDTLFAQGYFTRPSKPPERLILDKKEKIFIEKGLGKQENFTWKAGLFDRSNLLISKDYSSYNKVFGLNSFKKKYSFSKPIFLRNDTICIFYAGYICGGECGEGNLIVYRKIHNQWERWLYLYGWLS